MNSVNFVVGNAPGRIRSSDEPRSFSGLRAAGENRVVGKRVLLVDNEQVVRKLTGRLLSMDEHVVVEANNGAEALSLFAKGSFDLVMTDFEIPFLKGNELATRIKQLAPGQPIIMITGYRKRPGPDNPVDAVLDKPFDVDQLRTAIAKLLSDVRPGLTD